MQAQRGALEVQIVIAGLARFGSSKVPTRTKIKCGRASASLNNGVPHCGQNRRFIRLPLSATLEKLFVLPVTLNVAVRKQAPTVPLPPKLCHPKIKVSPHTGCAALVPITRNGSARAACAQHCEASGSTSFRTIPYAP